MGNAERMVELLGADGPRLDRLMAIVASVDRSAPAEEAVMAGFDELAKETAGCSTSTELLVEVFGGLGFRGNTTDYYDARNSLIHHVLERRVGIPLSLAVVAVELGRRSGFELSAIGLPGHVVLSDGSSDRWFDPFNGGTRLTRAGCEAIVQAIRPDAPFEDRFLDPMSTATIVGRTLENLRAACLHSGDRSQLASVLELRARMPGAPTDFGIEYAAVLAALGRLDAAAAERDLLASAQPARANKHRSEAKRLRASRN